MDDSVRLARKAAVALIAAASVFVGLLLIWYFVRPGVIRLVTTPHMLVLLGLFLMPVVTLAAWEMERRVRAGAPVEPPVSALSDEPGARALNDGAAPEHPLAARLIRHDDLGLPGQPRHPREAGHRRAASRNHLAASGAL